MLCRTLLCGTVALGCVVCFTAKDEGFLHFVILSNRLGNSKLRESELMPTGDAFY
jgi:hypothetical protein